MWQQLSLGHYTAIFKLARQRTLQASDAPQLPKTCTSQTNGSNLRNLWTIYQGKYKKLSLLWCLYDLYGGRVLFHEISLCLYSIVSFSGPVMLHLLVECAENNSSWAQVLFLLFV